MNEEPSPLISWAVGMALIIGVILGGLWAWNSIRVWMAETSGRAQLAEAEFSKRVQIEEAKGNLEAQKLNSQAEVERARGAAQAIEIEAGKLTENYIRYLWVQQQDNLNDKTVIYIPTEAGLPVLEAPRLEQ